MTTKQRDIYMANARHADDNALKAADTTVKDAWRKIAEGYRVLASRSK